MKLIKTRKIRLSGSSRNFTRKIAQQLSEMNGVNKLEFNERKGVLTITYDLESIMFKKIEEMLTAQGLQLDNSLLARWKRGWVHFSEQNELDNFHVQPSCCTDPKILTK
ncbi:MAG: heavy-metal-associated domain-containing protein [Candidatus Hodarchaeota archaeon]